MKSIAFGEKFKKSLVELETAELRSQDLKFLHNNLRKWGSSLDSKLNLQIFH